MVSGVRLEMLGQVIRVKMFGLGVRESVKVPVEGPADTSVCRSHVRGLL